jgi:hypothetical protein
LTDVNENAVGGFQLSAVIFLVMPGINVHASFSLAQTGFNH